MSFIHSRFVLSLSLVALVSAASAFADPKVGDSATLDGTLVGPGLNAKVVTSQKITAYNANTGVYTIAQSQTVAGQTDSREVQATADDMMTEDQAAAVVSMCESGQIGKKEKITVGAGAFDTCHAVGNDGTELWIAAVPFGIVKLQTKVQAGTVSLGASGFTRGQ
ncbi:MAG: hypothetical protein JST04_10445 [Bdellovibrionales bacterium]|nr:hypothetical protein [Bdellovibrionales bacterium]